jgi:hypothetical protein
MLFISTAGPAFAGNMDPAAVKAAFVLNFARYTVWPDIAFSDAATPINLYVYGGKKTWKAFRNIDGQQVGARKIRVRLMKPAETVDNCHIMFVDHDVDRKILATMLAAVKRQPVLTVGETEDFITLGGIINIFRKNERFYFEIKPSRASRGGLRISSRLLKLAIILDD